MSVVPINIAVIACRSDIGLTKLNIMDDSATDVDNNNEVLITSLSTLNFDIFSNAIASNGIDIAKANTDLKSIPDVSLNASPKANTPADIINIILTPSLTFCFCCVVLIFPYAVSGSLCFLLNSIIVC